MAASNDNPSASRNCPQCGVELPAGTPPELCPKCLLQAGLNPQAGQLEDTLPIPPPPLLPQELLKAGQVFGHYKIVRALGGGGMGAVFEAEDLESGRRLALKVLSHALDSPDARERFFREGRLAASINHPNSVYVFGTEEIVGTPVITMELVSGGTLQDRVQSHGPMPWAQAVDATLQIIAGLEAAQQVGILHRDVKPSNCFLDADGATKVGDFGLSISTAIRTEPSLTATGAFLGTPAFCSPEQLRGEELNARSDIYSVGATLFYLLTGRTPFEAKNVVALLATVLEQSAPSPRKYHPQVPQGLAKAVRRCLEKQPGARFRTYDEVRQALAPYSSAAPVPAMLGLRFLAGIVDLMVINLVFMMAALLILGNPMQFLDMASHRSPVALGFMAAGLTMSICYYAVLEAVRGATLGKALCRLQVVGPGRGGPGFWRALLRAMIYVVLPMVPFWAFYGGDVRALWRSAGFAQYAMSFSYYGILVLLFSTARRRNGFAAIQDLVTNTRVIARVALRARPFLPATESAPTAVEGTQLVGPYHVLNVIEPGHWLLGYDLRLLRKVWIQLVPPGTPPVPVQLRNLGRAGRLRWLTGKRSPDGNWDAYEAPTGQSLLALSSTAQPWSRVRYWLDDLAAEISLAEKERSMPVLALDRVWITGDGRAKLLDFPAPGIVPTSDRHGEAPVAAATFLRGVAAAALGGGVKAALKAADDVSVPLPLHARAFLDELPKLSDAAAVKARIAPLLPRVAVVSRWRRASVVAGCLSFPLLATVCMIFGFALLQRWNQNNPGLMDLSSLLQQHSMMNHSRQSHPVPKDEQYAVYIAGHYRSIITNETVWSSPMTLAMIKGDSRRFAEQCVASHPAPTEKEIADAETALKPYGLQSGFPDFASHPGSILVVAFISMIAYVFIPALLAALLFRGGLVLRIANVTFVRRDGARASRLRVVWRALVAWSPLWLAAPLCLAFARGHPVLGQALACGVVCGLAAISVALPQRSLPDRLAGTWPVPR